MIAPHQNGQPEHAERQVDEEDGAPSEGGDQEPSQGRPGEGCRPPHATEESLDAGALFESKDIAQYRENDRHDASGAESLESAIDDELRHGVRGGGEHRADREEQDGEKDHPFAAHDVGEPAIKRHADGGSKQVNGCHPRVMFQPVEGADDGRHGRAGDGLLHRGKHHDQHEGGGDGAAIHAGANLPRGRQLHRRRRHHVDGDAIAIGG